MKSTNEKVLDLIIKWEIPMSWIAKEIGMSQPVFNNKLKKNGKYNYFKDAEIESIKNVLLKLSEDILAANGK